MKKAVTKRFVAKTSRAQLPQKPYGFCCDEKNQDFEKRYDMQNPPFASSLTSVALDGSGPAVKLRVEDTGRSPHPIQRKMHEVKGAAYLGRCKRCRGPLRWYLEDEIAFAREYFVEEKRNDYDARTRRNLRIAKE